jgi:hypothetical protein
MNEIRIAFVFVLAVVGWFGYAIERERRVKAENKIKKFYGVKCEEQKTFLQNINAADVKEILEKQVKTGASAIRCILVMLAVKAAAWLSLLKRSMMEPLSINNKD